MSIINYEQMSNATDIRIVKTRQAIYRALIELLSEKGMDRITITELCSRAMINRKTFYVHYKSIMDVVDDLENEIVAGMLDRLMASDVFSNNWFDPHNYILFLDSLVNESWDDFAILFPFIKKGLFFRKFGGEMGRLALAYAANTPSLQDVPVYTFAFVFALCGLTTSYIDWVDFGRQFPVSELADISRQTFDRPMNSFLSFAPSKSLLTATPLIRTDRSE